MESTFVIVMFEAPFEKIVNRKLEQWKLQARATN